MKKANNSINFRKFPKLNLERTLEFYFWISNILFWFNTENMFISTNFTSIFLKLMYNIVIKILNELNPFEILLQKRICPIMHY